MKIKILKENKEVVLPFKKHKRDLCFDVKAHSVEKLRENVWKYGLGFKLEMVPETEEEILLYEAGCYSIDLRPRSSIWETGMLLSNGPGTIDEDFRGQPAAIFYHIFPELPKYEVGDKIGQIVVCQTIPVTFEEAESLSETIRGENGFGSTGK